MALDPNMKLHFDLDLQTIARVVNILQKQPFIEVHDLVATLKAQGDPQIAAALAAQPQVEAAPKG